MDSSKSASAKRSAVAKRNEQDIKAFKQSPKRGGPSAGTQYTHVPSGEPKPPPMGFSTWHEFYKRNK